MFDVVVVDDDGWDWMMQYLSPWRMMVMLWMTKKKMMVMGENELKIWVSDDVVHLDVVVHVLAAAIEAADVVVAMMQ